MLIKLLGKIRTSLTSAGVGGNFTEFITDKVGRIISYPYQVRDLIATSQAELATLAEVTLLAGATGTFHDLVEITCANNSGAAVRISLRDNIAGGVVKTFDIPATNTITQTFPIPIPQNEAANSWTIQNAASGDVSGTTITVSAIFIKNI